MKDFIIEILILFLVSIFPFIIIDNYVKLTTKVFIGTKT